MTDAPVNASLPREVTLAATGRRSPRELGAARGAAVLAVCVPLALLLAVGHTAREALLGVGLALSLALVAGAEVAVARAVEAAATTLGRAAPPWLVAGLGLMATAANLRYVDGVLGGGPGAGLRALGTPPPQFLAVPLLLVGVTCAATALGVFRAWLRAGLEAWVRSLLAFEALAVGLGAALHLASTLAGGVVHGLAELTPVLLVVTLGQVLAVGLGVVVLVVDQLAEWLARWWWPTAEGSP